MNRENNNLDPKYTIEESVSRVAELFKMKLYLYLLVGGIFYSLFLVITRGATYGIDTLPFWLHVIFFGSVTTFFIIALKNKKHSPYVGWLLSILFMLSTSLYLTSNLGIKSPVYHFYTALMVVSMFLIGMKFCSTIYILTNLMYLASWTKFPDMLGIEALKHMYEDDHYFYFSRVGSLCFIYFSLVFFDKLKKSQHEMILQMSRLHRDSEKHTVSKQIISGFAHEINNPLAIISSASSQLKRNPDRLDYFNKISNSVNRISEILRTLLDSIEEQESKDFELNFSELLEKVIENLGIRNLPSGKLKLIVNIDHTLFANVNEDYLYKIVNEILKNAKEAAETADHASDVLVSLKEENGWYAFEVKDNARQLPREKIEKVSTLFYTTKQDKPGRGIGLYLVSSICQKLNWKFDISINQEYTCAKILIPEDKIIVRH